MSQTNSVKNVLFERPSFLSTNIPGFIWDIELGFSISGDKSHIPATKVGGIWGSSRETIKITESSALITEEFISSSHRFLTHFRYEFTESNQCQKVGDFSACSHSGDRSEHLKVCCRYFLNKFFSFSNVWGSHLQLHFTHFNYPSWCMSQTAMASASNIKPKTYKLLTSAFSLKPW